MATPVSGNPLNLFASGSAANPDPGRNAANGALRLSFSDLLRGQAQGNFAIRAFEIPSLTDTRPAPVPETVREIPRARDDSFSPSARLQASRPSQEPTREPARTNSPDSLPETGQSVTRQTETREDSAPSQQANAETGESDENSEKEKISGNIALIAHPLQPQQTQLADAAISPDLPATIAVLLNGFAGEIAKDIPGSDADPETSDQDALTGHSRHPDMTGRLPARAAVYMDNNMQAGVNTESDTGDNNGQEANPNASAALTGRVLRHSASTNNIAPAPQGQPATPSSAGNESPPRINATASDIITNAANAVSTTPRGDGGTRAVPAGITANAENLSMLNPPRLPVQAGAILSQFTIPAGAGQRTWAEEIGNRVMWMLGRAENRAELILTPPHLGKVEVSIHLNGDQGTAQFLASSQSAREALEQAMPRLRELLAQAGISLGEANVNTSPEGRTQDFENTPRMGMHASDALDGDNDGDATAITAPSWTRLDNGLIDTFA